MHSIAETGTVVPAFIGKLWSMVEDPETNDLIAWSSCGTSFMIKDEIRFAKELLPMYYKHNNMASFIRQLNMYGFHKIVSLDAGSMKLETPNEIKFTHPYFMENHPYLLQHIKRKNGVSKALSGGQVEENSPQVLNNVLNEVKLMKGRQDNMDSRLRAMKIENVALWRELSLMRQKHIKQQQIVNKLIQFLITIVQQNHSSFSFKRKYPRMLQDHSKLRKSELENIKGVHGGANSEANSPSGPVIHELDPAEALLETVVEEAEADTPTDVADLYLHTSENDDVCLTTGDVEMPESVEDYTLDDPNIETIIGLPEDTIIFNPGLSHLNIQQPKILPSKRTPQPSTTSYFLANTKQANLSVKPNFLKNITENLTEKPQKIRVVHGYKPQTTKRPHELITIEPREVDLKPEQIYTGLNKQPGAQMNRPQFKISQQPQNSYQRLQPKNPHHLKLLINAQKNLQNNQSVQQQKSHQPQVKVNRAQKKQQTHKKKPELKKNQQLKTVAGATSKKHLQTIKQELQPTPVTIITVPYDTTGSSSAVLPETITSDFTPLVVDGAVNTLQSQPVVVEVPAQPSPQDLLSSSPIVINDPVMTPQCNSVPSPVQASPVNNMQVACVDETQNTSPSHLTRSGCLLSEMDNHLDSVQSDLESLKELLQCEGISLDANALLGYLNDDPMNFNMPEPGSNEDPNRLKENSGNEVMTYSPSLLDLTDLMGNDWSLPSPSPGENVSAEDHLQEVNTPLVVPQSPSFVSSGSKKRKK